MASNSNIFALLLAGLDVNASAEEINKQLNSSEFQGSLDGLKATLDLDPDTFKALEKAMSNTKMDAKELKNSLSEAANLFEKMQSKKPEVQASPETIAPFREHASTMIPGEDLKMIKAELDSTTQAIEKVTFEFGKVGDVVQRVQVSIDELDGSFTMGPIKVVETLRTEFKNYEKDLASVAVELKKLQKEESEFGANIDRTEQMDKLKDDMVGSYMKIGEAAEAAQAKESMSAEQTQEFMRQVGEAYNRTEESLKQYDLALADGTSKDAAIAGLKQYKKEVEELSKLQNKEQVEGADFSGVDKERLVYLKQNTEQLLSSLAAYPKLIEQAKTLSSTQEKSAKLDLGEKEVKQAELVLKDLSKQYGELAKAQHQIDMGSLKEGTSEFTAELEKQKSALLENIKTLEGKLESTKSTAAGQIASVEGLSQAESDYQTVVDQNAAKFRDAIESQERAVEKFAGSSMDLIADIDFTTLADQLDATNPKFQDLAKELYGTKAEVKSLKEANDGLGNTYTEMVVVQDRTADRLAQTTIRINQQTGALGELGTTYSQNLSRAMGFTEQLGHAIKKMSVWALAAKLLHGSINELKKGFEFVKELDKDITQAAIVTGVHRSEVKGLAAEYATLAMNMGKTVVEVSAVNTALLRQGLSMDESQGRLDTIIKLSAAGQISTEESLHVVTAAVNSMQESHVHAADVMLKASNISASSVGELGEAFTKTAASAHATGMSIEETTGLLATMMEITQEGPSQLGTSLKTILARFSKVNEETGELNEHLNDVQTAAESVGVAFLDSDGQIRSVYDILQDMAEVWPTLTKNQQAYIATTSAGVRMQSRFFAIMNNFERVKEITEEAGDSAFAMNDAYDVYLSSVEASANTTKAALESLWIDTLDSGVITSLFDSMTSVIQVIEKIGVSSVITGLSTIVLMKQLGDLTGLDKSFQKLGGEFSKAFALAREGSSVAAAGMKGFTTALFSVEMQAAATQAAITLGLSLAISLLVKGIASFIASTAEAKRANEEFIQSFRGNMDAINGNITSLEDLESEYVAIQASKKDYSDLNEREKEVVDQLIALNPSMIKGYGDRGEKIVDLTGNIDDMIEKLEKAAELENDSMISKGSDLFKESVKEATDAIQKGNDLTDELQRLEEGVNLGMYGRIQGIDELTKIIETGLSAYGTEMSSAGIEEAKERLETLTKRLHEVTVEMTAQELTVEAADKKLQGLARAIIENSAGYKDLGKESKTAIGIFISSINSLEQTDMYQFQKDLEGFLDKIANADMSGLVDEYGRMTERLQNGTLSAADFNERVREIIAQLLLIEGLDPDMIKKLFLTAGNIERTKTEIDEVVMSLEEFYEASHKAGQETKVVDEALHELNKTGSLSKEMYDKLIATNPEFTKLLGLEEGAIFDVLNASKSRRASALQDQIDMLKAVAEATRKRIAIYQHEANVLRRLSQMAIGAGNNPNDAHYATGGKGHNADAAALQKRLNYVNGLLSSSNAELAGTDAEIAGFEKAFDTNVNFSSGGGFKPKDDKKNKSGGGKSEKDKKEEERVYSDDQQAQIRLMRSKNKELDKTREYLKEELTYANDSSTVEGLQAQQVLHEQLNALNEKKIINLGNERAAIEAASNAFQSQHKQYDMSKWFDVDLEPTVEFYAAQDKLGTQAQADHMQRAFDRAKQYKAAAKDSDKIRKETLKDLRDTKIAEDAIFSAKMKIWDAEREKAVEAHVKKVNDGYEQQRKNLSAIEMMQEKLIAVIRKRGEEEKKAMDKAHKAEMDSLDDRHNKKKEMYQKDLDDFNRAIQDKLDALEEQYQSEDYLEELKKEQDEVNRLQQEINVLALDDSLAGKNKAEEMRKKLADQIEKIAKLQQKKERETLKQSLQDQLKDHTEQNKEKNDALDESFDKEKKRIEANQLLDQEAHEFKYSNAQVYSEARRQLMDAEADKTGKMYDDMIASFKRYEDEFGAGLGIMGGLIQTELIDRFEEFKNGMGDGQYNIKVPDNISKEDGFSDETIGYEKPQELVDKENADKQAIVNEEKQLKQQAYLHKRMLEAIDTKNEGLKKWIREERIRWGLDPKSGAVKTPGKVAPGFADGGKNVTTGMHMLHGTQGDPEWIFNDSQLKKTIQQASLRSLEDFRMKQPQGSGSAATFKIEKMIEINGNVDKNVLPQIHKAGNDIVEAIKELNKGGTFRPIKIR